jgi:site-specific recombinase XerD
MGSHEDAGGGELVPILVPELLADAEQGVGLPALVAQVGPAARFAWDELFKAHLQNSHTRMAYRRAVLRFLAWCEAQGLELRRVTPGTVGDYFDHHPGSIPTKKQHLAAIRRFFDVLVMRHVTLLNPATSIRLERYQAVEGKTPEITVEQARTLLSSIDTSHVVGLRDRAVIGILIYTAARVGALAKLRLKDFTHDGTQWTLRFEEKGGKSREIPVRHELERFILEYLDAAGIRNDPKENPLLRTAANRTKRLTARPMTGVYLSWMVKRRIKDAGLPLRLSPHSFRVATITDLLNQGVPLEDVQYLAGHADPRTTRLYDRRQKRVTRNVVERISI